MNIKNEFNELKTNSDKTFNLSILFVTIILFIYCYLGSYSFFDKYITIENHAYFRIIYHNIMAFILFFVIGIIFTKFILKKPLKEFYLGKGDWKFGLKFMGLATLVIPLLALSTTTSKAMIETYPPINFDLYAWWQIALYFLSYILYYIGWEYLFRCIALEGTIRQASPLGAILLTTMISALIHTSIAGFGKPLIETLSAIPAGIIFGYVTYKTKSIYYSLYAHTLIGILTDLFIFLIV